MAGATAVLDLGRLEGHAAELERGLGRYGGALAGQLQQLARTLQDARSAVGAASTAPGPVSEDGSDSGSAHSAESAPSDPRDTAALRRRCNKVLQKGYSLFPGEISIVPTSAFQETLLRVLNSKWFQLVSGALIVLNSLLLGLQLHRRLTRLLDNGEHTRNWLSELLAWLDTVFIVMFSMEAIYRLLAERRQFFTGPNRRWNCFDVMMVYFGVLEKLDRLRHGPGSHLSILRLLRAVRIIRVFRFLSEFRLMFFSMLSVMISLMWGLLFLFVVVYSYALYLESSALEYLKEHNVDPKTLAEACDPELCKFVKDMQENWMGIPMSMLSLIYSIFGGQDWAQLMEPFWAISWLEGLLYVIFMLCTTQGLLNIMIGVFAQETAAIMEWDKELVLDGAIQTEIRKTQHLDELFSDIDADGMGTISLKELKDGLKDPRVIAHFTHLNIDTAKSSIFFDFLDSDGSGQVGRDEFVKGCMRLHGDAKAVDVALACVRFKNLERKMEAISSRVERLEATWSQV